MPSIISSFKAAFVSWKPEITFQTFLCLFAIRKVGVNRKHFPVKEKFGQRKTLSGQ
jgi:hypothetical protein